MEINIRKKIKVKLTEKGKMSYTNYYFKLGVIMPIVLDESGMIETNICLLASIFGNKISECIDGDIYV